MNSSLSVVEIMSSVGLLSVGIGWVIGNFFKGRNNFTQETISGYEAAIRERDLRLRDADERLANLKNGYDQKILSMSSDIAMLQGQVETLKNIPLEKIDITLNKILENLNRSSETLNKNTLILDKHTRFVDASVEAVRRDLKQHNKSTSAPKPKKLSA